MDSVGSTVPPNTDSYLLYCRWKTPRTAMGTAHRLAQGLACTASCHCHVTAKVTASCFSLVLYLCSNYAHRMTELLYPYPPAPMRAIRTPRKRMLSPPGPSHYSYQEQLDQDLGPHEYHPIYETSRRQESWSDIGNSLYVSVVF